MNVCGLDLETTGLDYSEGDKIIEICMRVYDYDTKALKLNYNKRIQPNCRIKPKAQAVHGITAEDLVGCPTFDKVAAQVVTILNKCDVVVAHNGQSFDLPFLVWDFVFKMPEIKVVDTMQESRWATFNGKFPKLQELCEAMDVEYDVSKAHAAEYDVDVMMNCFFKGVTLGQYEI